MICMLFSETALSLCGLQQGIKDAGICGSAQLHNMPAHWLHLWGTQQVCVRSPSHRESCHVNMESARMVAPRK